MGERRKWTVWRLTGAFMICGIMGCANVPDQAPNLAGASQVFDSPRQDAAGEAEVPSNPFLSLSMDEAPPAHLTSNEPVTVTKQARQQKTPARKKETLEEGEPYDPFQTEEDRRAAAAEEYDPWESYNTAVFEFNRKVDKYVLKPVATVYEAILPDALERGIRNFFHNVRFVPRFMNNLFQGKVKGASLEMGRFLVNSTLGVAGFVDFAKDVLEWETPDEDLGQTLGVYGAKPGPYLIVPFLAPFTLRDAIGYVGDIFLDPINYLVFPSIELDGAPSLIDHTDRDTTTFLQLGTRIGEIVNERALNLETFQGVEEATIDLYGAVRNAYLQRRAKQIRE